MKKFEYKTIKMPTKKGWSYGMPDVENFVRELNKLGKQGWELTTSPSSFYREFILKREI